MSPFSDDLVSKAVYQQRFAGLALADVDLQTYKTWDVYLPRSYRILVPIDVQAFVVPEQGGEATVPVGAVMGDPGAFGASQVRPAGVHLHWALPDRLLAGVADQTAKKLVMPALPDRWVVVRTLLPEGTSTAYATGWVIDAAQRCRRATRLVRRHDRPHRRHPARAAGRHQPGNAVVVGDLHRGRASVHPARPAHRPARSGDRCPRTASTATSRPTPSQAGGPGSGRTRWPAPSVGEACANVPSRWAGRFPRTARTRSSRMSTRGSSVGSPRPV